MAKIKICLSASLIACSALFCSQAAPQTPPPPPGEAATITVEGRLETEKHGNENWLVLHAKDAETYYIIGGLLEKMHVSLRELGEKNLVSVSGVVRGKGRVHCQHITKRTHGDKRQEALQVITTCVRYNGLEIKQILSAKKSDEKMPPPKRDLEEEKRALWSSQRYISQRESKPIVGIYGECTGEVVAVNMKSPIKTVEVKTTGKETPGKTITMIIAPDTLIIKKVGDSEPLSFAASVLAPGQEVTAVYNRDEFKTTALAITITKE